jgi:DNA-binding transcriptional ArsR family regulator
MTEPIDEVLRITTPAQHRGLAHPMRERLMMRLSEDAVTISQLSRMLGVGKGSVAYHLNVLREAGMVRVVRRRTVRGGTEQYYQVAARKILLGERPQTVAPLLGAVAADIDAADEVPVLQHQVMHLTDAQAERLIATLYEVAHNLDDTEDDREPRYGVIVGLYRYRDPQPLVDHELRGVDTPSRRNLSS